MVIVLLLLVVVALMLYILIQKRASSSILTSSTPLTQVESTTSLTESPVVETTEKKNADKYALMWNQIGCTTSAPTAFGNDWSGQVSLWATQSDNDAKSDMQTYYNNQDLQKQKKCHNGYPIQQIKRGDNAGNCLTVAGSILSFETAGWWPCDTALNSSQLWSPVDLNDGWFGLRSQYNNKCLKTGGNAHIWYLDACDTDNQASFKQNGKNLTVKSNGLCLDGETRKTPYLSTCDPTNANQWYSFSKAT